MFRFRSAYTSKEESFRSGFKGMIWYQYCECRWFKLDDIWPCMREGITGTDEELGNALILRKSGANINGPKPRCSDRVTKNKTKTHLVVDGLYLYRHSVRNNEA